MSICTNNEYNIKYGENKYNRYTTRANNVSKAKILEPKTKNILSEPKQTITLIYYINVI